MDDVADVSQVAEPAAIGVHGDVKSFFFAYGAPEVGASSVGILDLRLKGTAEKGWFSAELHNTVTASTGTFTRSAGVGFAAPEAVDLSWDASSDGLGLRGRLDRAVVRAEATGIQVALGRQAISLGMGRIFTPLDLVNPFTPVVVDQEYKPGVDAARVDIFPGATSRITVASAYAGSWDAGGTVTAAYGQATVGSTDLGVLAGLVHGDVVAGGAFSGGLGPIGLYGDVALTVPTAATPGGRDDPFVRGVVGGLWRPAEDTTVSAEVYLQTFGRSTPIFADALHPRYQRGELWLYDVLYAGVAVSQQLTPLTALSVAAVVDVGTDHPSALLTPSLAWSVAENAELAAGAFAGVGARPTDAGVPRSEFGTYPITGFGQLKAYF